jgi:F-type H+-transporting ATPase subunit alpha
VETQRGNISAYIPTNIISITDGQIYLDTDRFNRGLKPAVHEGLSVSRVGGAAQTRAMRAVSGDLRLELSQYEEVAQFALLGTEVDEATQHQLARGERLQAALRQPQYQPLTVCAQVAQLFAVTRGFLDDIPVRDVGDFVDSIPGFVEETQAYLYRHVNRTGEWNEELGEMLEEALRAYHAKWTQR